MAGRDGYVLSHDSEARITTRVYDVDGLTQEDTIFGRVDIGGVPKHEGSQAVVHVTEQDVGPLIEHMKEQRKSASSWRPATTNPSGPSGLQFVGRIPNFMLSWLNRKGILWDNELFREFMDSDVMKPYRANSVALSRKGMRRKYGGKR